MNEITNKEPVQRVIKALDKFDKNLKIQVLKDTARTAKDAANALNCEEGAIVKSLVFKAATEFLIWSTTYSTRAKSEPKQQALKKR